MLKIRPIKQKKIMFLEFFLTKTQIFIYCKHLFFQKSEIFF